MKAAIHALIPILRPGPAGGPGKPLLNRQIEDQGQRGLQPIDDRPAERTDEIPIEAMTIALIGQGRIGEAVAQDPLAVLQRGPHRRAQVLVAGGIVQQCLRRAVPAFGRTFDQKRADHLGARRAPRFAGRHDFAAAGLEPGFQLLQLGRLPRAFAALQGDEAPTAIAHDDSQPNR